jgi:predicted DNA-binding transcriptional regulator AlpA
MARRTTNHSRTTRAPTDVALEPGTRAALDHLPPDVTRRRILNTAQAAELCGISVPHWRRLYRAGKVPKPIRLSARKYGWSIGTLLDFIDGRAEAV